MESLHSFVKSSNPNIRSSSESDRTIASQLRELQDMLGVESAQMVFNPNASWTSAEDILPKWDTYHPRNTEMWFGEVGFDQPDVRTIESDPRLLERCR